MPSRCSRCTCGYGSGYDTCSCPTPLGSCSGSGWGGGSGWDEANQLSAAWEGTGVPPAPWTSQSASLLTFKEDEPPVMPLIGSIDVSGEAPPEVPDGHGVVVQHPVVTDPPEPPALMGNGVLDRGWGRHRDTAPVPATSLGGSSHPGTHHTHREGAEWVPAGTLNTNISPRSTATVSKFPSQMSGPYWSGRSGLPGLGGRSGFPGGRGLGGLWSGLPGLQGVTVGKGLVG